MLSGNLLRALRIIRVATECSHSSSYSDLLSKNDLAKSICIDMEAAISHFTALHFWTNNPSVACKLGPIILCYYTFFQN